MMVISILLGRLLKWDWKCVKLVVGWDQGVEDLTWSVYTVVGSI